MDVVSVFWNKNDKDGLGAAHFFCGAYWQVREQRRSMRNGKAATAQALRCSVEELRRLAGEALLPWGYELVDLSYTAGLIRVFIDWPAAHDRRITIEDCENVSRQLSQLLMVADVDYRRLEVSSPGLDRPLRTAHDFQRFSGCQVRIRLRELLQGRRQWEGRLVPAAALAGMPDVQADGSAVTSPEGAPGESWALLLDAPQGAQKGRAKRPQRSGRAPGKARADHTVQADASGWTQVDVLSKAAAGTGQVAPLVLCFRLEELESAQLVPQWEF